MFRFRSALVLGAAAVLGLAVLGCDDGNTVVNAGGGPSEGISVNGEGRVSSAPDIATIRLGVRVGGLAVPRPICGRGDVRVLHG